MNAAERPRLVEDPDQVGLEQQRRRHVLRELGAERAGGCGLGPTTGQAKGLGDMGSKLAGQGCAGGTGAGIVGV